MRLPVGRVVVTSSLVLSAVALAAWIWSLFGSASFHRHFVEPVGATSDYHVRYVGILGGALLVKHYTIHLDPHWSQLEAGWEGRNGKKHDVGGFAFDVNPKRLSSGAHIKLFRRREPPGELKISGVKAQIPLWVIAILWVLPALAARLSRLRKRRLREWGLCARCGYDLRASSERCPECGGPVPAGDGFPRRQEREHSATELPDDEKRIADF